MTSSTIWSEYLSLPVTSNFSQAVRISRQLISLPVSQPTPISLGLLKTRLDFLVRNSLPPNLFGRHLSCKLNATMKSKKKGIFIFLPLYQNPEFPNFLTGN